MAFFLKAKKLDFSSGDNPIVVFNELDANNFGIRPGDRVEIDWKMNKTVVNVDTTKTKVKKGEMGLFRETVQKTKIRSGDIVYFNLFDRPTSIKAINKKLKGQTLSYHEIYSIIRDVLRGHISDSEMAFFIATSFAKEMDNNELYNLTKAMVDTGKKISFPGKKVVDKHCIGGIPGNRTTMIVVPIIASLGLYIPKTSSRAITSPAGTADTMEVLAPVKFSLKDVIKMVNKNKACLIWGGATNIAPADDIIVKLTRKLSLEPLSKMIVSIMAKKVAMGIQYLLIDIPIGPTAKIKDMRTAKKVSKKFMWLSKKFNIKTTVTILKTLEPVGRGIGPALEARDVLRVLQQKSRRSHDLEKKSLYLSGVLLELCGRAKKGKGLALATNALRTRRAWEKMRQIINAQGGNGDIDSEEIVVGASRARLYASKAGKIIAVDNRAIDEVARSLGAPYDKLAGIRLHQRLGHKVKKGDKLLTIFGRNKERIILGKKALSRVRIFIIR